MKEATPKAIHLKDYQLPNFLIPKTHLTFELDETQTIVSSKLSIERNAKSNDKKAPLILNGEKMQLKNIKIDGRELLDSEYSFTDSDLTIFDTPDHFLLEIQNEIDPEGNKALEGLYKSGSIFCTQNEPEGFRRITYFLDRSDVMGKYTTKIIADKGKYPILLSNGNPIGSGELEGGKHWCEWEDPFNKPSYLFALVAGDLGLVQDTYTTCSGRKIDLRIYVDKGNESRCDHAMKSLKKSMKWDEDVFGLEYDLDIYMIVAADAFNMGAMENKGLNIFNSKLVLANPETATDDVYHAIEGVVGHEYFHNWTGNRVTCRDWFQLTLKEGLTVFRDQEFSSDMQSRPVQRIDDVNSLRQRQYPEDAGPMAHPIRPASFIEINNFYTATVYEKGAEVIRMIHTLIGKDVFRKGIDKYFELYDGQAVTCEDFINAMTIASGRDFTQFMNWYNYAGTPNVVASWDYDSAKSTLSLNVSQNMPEIDGQEDVPPFHFPFSVGLLNTKGEDIKGSAKILEITKEEETFVFENISEKPLVSLNRSFSAPINLETNYSDEELAFLLAHDTDSFNRREASQVLATRVIKDLVERIQNEQELHLNSAYDKAIGTLLADKSLDQSLKALALSLPAQDELFQLYDTIPFDAIFEAKEFILNSLAKNHEAAFFEIYGELNTKAPYEFTPKEVGRRNLKNAALFYLARCGEKYFETIYEQFSTANNMSDELSALYALGDYETPYRQKTLDEFEKKWKHDSLVMHSWLTAQSASILPGALERTKKLMEHESFDLKIPNSVRALIGGLAQNYNQFHDASGEGYRFLGNIIIKLDRLNPLIASGLAKIFRSFAHYDEIRKAKATEVLEKIVQTDGLSKNTFEIISKTLGQSK
jgi:aminopeptidase N